MGVAITTNHHVREFLFQWDVPDDVLDSQFEHLDSFEATTGFFKYRGWWYHVSDFVRISGVDNLNNQFEPWDGYSSDSFFSGVLIKLHRDGETYTVGTYMKKEAGKAACRKWRK
tara:strand:- start:169 stop:510 length:342 start_codon:yes stop_codon:yes gene_type:complete